LYANREYLNSPIAGKTTKRLITLSADPDTRLAAMSDAFIEKVASILGTPVEFITTSNPLSFYGLDSIVAVELRKWFNETADVNLSLFDVLSAKSINALVAKVVKSMPQGKDNAADGTRDTETSKGNHINGELSSNSLASSSHIPKAMIAGPIPMSTFQTRMFFQHMFLEEQWRLNLSGIFGLRGKPNINALHQSHREVVLRHPVLNSAFCSDGDILEQRILPEAKYQLVVHDLSGETHTEERLDKLVSEYKHRNLDIEQGEVAAWALIKISDEEYVLVIVAHHICFDRGSLFILMNTWIDLYNTLSSGRDSDTVLPPRINYTDFTLWHNDRLQSEDNVSHLKFWQEYLHGAPETSQLLPFSKQERPEIMMPETAICQLHVAQNLVARMKRICAQINVTPFHFLLAAFRAFLFRYTGDRDTVLLMVDGNRPHIEAEDLVGCFVNMVPLRFQEDCNDMEFDSLVKSASEITLQSLSHSQIAFDEIVNSLQLPRRPGHMPVGQISINYQMHGALPTYRTSDFEVTADSLSNIPTPYEIALEAVENGDDNGLSLSVEYCTALYGAESMDRFSENFVTFLTSAIRDHRQPISEIDLCGAKEKQHLQANFWNTQFVEDAWADTTILQRIYSFAKTSPHHEAIKTSSGDSISYSELLQKASKLAYTMNDVGNLSSAVGVFMKAGTECIIGVLATLITSKCYVPLATSHVDDRLSFIIQDAGIGLVLTTEELRGRAESLVTKSGVNAQIITIKNEAVISEQQLPTFTKCNPDQPFYMIYTSVSITLRDCCWDRGLTVPRGALATLKA
jgi:acyl carrier protein